MPNVSNSLLIQSILVGAALGRAYRVYSDVDDTAVTHGYGSMKSLLFGADTSKTAGQTYAGYESFVYHLSTGGDAARTTAGISFCTARPDIFFLRKSKAYFEGKINKHRVGPKRVVVDKILYGHFLNTFDYEEYGLRKYQQIKKDIRIRRNRARSADPSDGKIEDGYVFIGDNAQGDAIAADKLLREGLIDYAFIHVVVADEIFKRKNGEIMIFKNYLHAAEIAQKTGAISMELAENIKLDYEKDYREYSELEKIIE